MCHWGPMPAAKQAQCSGAESGNIGVPPESTIHSKTAIFFLYPSDTFADTTRYSAYISTWW